MTIFDLIRILQDYARDYGFDRFISIADADTIIGDAMSVGIDSQTGDIVISTQN